MKNLVLALFTVLIVVNGAYALDAKNEVKDAIKLYKSGNYVASMQTLEESIANDPTSSLAHYYLAISYIKLGKKKEAIEAYNNVLSLGDNKYIMEYAKHGLKILGEYKEKNKLPSAEDIDKAIKPVANSIDGVIKKQRLENVKDIVNQSGDVDVNMLELFEDFSPDLPDKNKEQADIDGSKQSSKKPTQEEVLKAMNTLVSAGINPNSGMVAMNTDNTFNNPEYIKNQMLLNSLGGNNMNSNNSNNSFNKMLPLMMMQNNGKNINPELMSSMLNSMMMPNMSMFSTGKNNF